MLWQNITQRSVKGWPHFLFVGTVWNIYSPITPLGKTQISALR